jgi:hypothetical protein
MVLWKPELWEGNQVGLQNALSTCDWIRVGHSRYCLILSHRFEGSPYGNRVSLGSAGPGGGILSLLSLLLQIDLQYLCRLVP